MAKHSQKMCKSAFLTALYPAFFGLLWFIKIVNSGILVFFISIYIFYCIFPFIFKYSRTMQKEILFLSHVAKSPINVFTSPANVGLYATRNFYITHYDLSVEMDITMGVWHILPNYVAAKFCKELCLTKNEKELIITKWHHKKFEQSIDRIETQIKSQFNQINQQNEGDFYEQMLNVSGAKIILYLHGNTGSRAKPHRILLYKVLREHGYHVITFDYRGYGDSMPTTCPLNEDVVVHDGIAIYNYIISKTKNPVLVWGHSLGAAISCHLLATLKQLKIYAPRCLVLESPFNNLYDAIFVHPIALLFRFLPWFHYTAIEGILNNGHFQSDEHILTFPQPILILHAKDDLIVPFELGYSLYSTAIKKRPKHWGPVEFHSFESERGFGHLHLENAPELPNIIQTFFDKFAYKEFQPNHPIVVNN